MAPAGTPAAILNKVSQDIAAVLKMPDVIEQMSKVGNIPRQPRRPNSTQSSATTPSAIPR